MSGILPILIVILIIAFTSANSKARQQTRSGRPGGPRPQGGAVPPPRPVPGARPKPAAPVYPPKENTRGDRSFERNADSLDKTFGRKTSNAADIKYTAHGCGCNESGEASAGRAHGYSNAKYDEDRFFEEAQEMRKGNWT